MMTMFILFAVMYIYQSAKREFLSEGKADIGLDTRVRHSAALNTVGKKSHDAFEISRLYDVSSQTLEANDLNEFASVELIKDRAVRIVVTGDLLFDTGKAELKTEARSTLRGIAPIIRNTSYMVNVVGHTDDVPIYSDDFPTNWELSVIRACVVTRFFIEEMKIPAGKFYLSGHAYYQPAVPNSSASNRAANRRVEIIMTKERPYGRPMRAAQSPDILFSEGEALWSVGS
jgi:chemotaxis protein MotB